MPEDLLDRGFGDITVLDISAKALEAARARLGERSGRVEWVVGDVTRVELPAARYDLWHDRAVFHFLTDEADRRAYVRQVLGALKPGGWLVMATFGPRGPEKCSGLEVVRYDDRALGRTLGPSFERVRSVEDRHVTPQGREQEFVYCLFRRIDGADQA